MDNLDVHKWLEEDKEDAYELRLFVNGTSPVSIRAIYNLKAFLETHLKGKYRLDIVDVHQQPQLLKSENIAAIPTLVRKFPLPKKLLIGDMSDNEKVLSGLGLK